VEGREGQGAVIHLDSIMNEQPVGNSYEEFLLFLFGFLMSVEQEEDNVLKIVVHQEDKVHDSWLRGNERRWSLTILGLLDEILSNASTLTLALVQDCSRIGD
jgi:hypothetical protein